MVVRSSKGWCARKRDYHPDRRKRDSHASTFMRSSAGGPLSSIPARASTATFSAANIASSSSTACGFEIRVHTRRKVPLRGVQRDTFDLFHDEQAIPATVATVHTEDHVLGLGKHDGGETSDTRSKTPERENFESVAELLEYFFGGLTSVGMELGAMYL